MPLSRIKRHLVTPYHPKVSESFIYFFSQSITHLFIFPNHEPPVNGHLERGLEVQAVFFDLQKAFDSVPHRLLIEKLQHLEVPSYLIRWISSYLHNRVHQVGVLGELSPPTSVVSGVSQGSVLGPLLFLYGLSGIQLSGGSIVLFADDLLLHRVITCIDDLDCIQNDIDELCNWLSSYKLTLNPIKYKSLLISRKRFQTVLHTVYVCEWRCSGKCTYLRIDT